MMRMQNKELPGAIITLKCALLSALLQTYVIQSMMQSMGLLSRGFTGLAVLLDRTTGAAGFPSPVSAGTLILNVPLALLYYRGLSKRLTSCPNIQFISSSIFLQLFHFQPISHDLLPQVLFDGFLYGFSAVIALREDASANSTGFTASYVSNCPGKSVWSYVFVGNVIPFYISGLLLGWLYAGYSVIFQYVTTRTIEVFYHRYERVTLETMTRNKDEVRGAYIRKYEHDMTIIPAYDGHSHNRIYLLRTVVPAYRVYDIIQLTRRTDPDVLVSMIKIEQFYGSFYQQSLE